MIKKEDDEYEFLNLEKKVKLEKDGSVFDNTLL
jgi:hypothetical protein